MAINFNGTNIDKVIYNGVELDKVIYNGVTVYESIDLTRSYFYIKNPSSEYREFKIRFNALSATSSTPLQIYYYYLGEGRERPTEPSETITKSGKKTLTFGLDGDGTAVIEFANSQFQEYSTSYTLFYKDEDQDLLTKAVIGSNCTGEYYLLNDNSELTEIIFATNEAFAISDAPKLSTITFKVNPKYFGSVSRTGITTFTVPANATSFSMIANNPNLKTLTICPTNISMGTSRLTNNTSLEHLYVYVTAESPSKSTAYSVSWVRGCNPNLVIHLSSTLNLSQAQTLFGPYFNYIDSTTQATVLFDL